MSDSKMSCRSEDIHPNIMRGHVFADTVFLCLTDCSVLHITEENQNEYIVAFQPDTFN